MEDIKKHAEAKIQEAEQQLSQMVVGIKARKALAGKLSDKIRRIKKCRYVIAKAGLSTDVIDTMHRSTILEFQENDAILSHLKDYRTEAHLDLMAFKKSLERLSED